MTEEPRAYTSEELREAVLAYIRGLVSYWAAMPEKTKDEKLNGLAFSILNIFDGTTAKFPAFDIVARPHEDDKAFHRACGGNWIEDGTIINGDVLLHELWYKQKEATE